MFMGSEKDQPEGQSPLESPQTRAILDSISDGVFTVDLQWHVTSFNRAAEDITGISRNEAVGRKCWDVLKASVCEADCPLARSLETGEPVRSRILYVLNCRGERVPVSISAAPLRDPDGEVVGGVETFRDLSAIETLRTELRGRYSFCDMVSKTPRMQQVFEVLPQIAASNSTVLIQGESGTGKEMVARAIHDLSPRREGPMVAVNCGALPDSLLESELFGHKAGAFTDARTDRQGRFAQAEGGTILLDEVGEMSARLQVSLLRVLEDGVYQPLGAAQAVQSNVRVIAASNRDLGAMVKEGAFRRDLYYRINVVTVSLPPLRERRQDIPLLADHFVGRFRRLTGKDIEGISADTLMLLMNHDFPGNVRELENIIEHTFVLCSGGEIESRHLPEALVGQRRPGSVERPVSLDELERTHIRHTLRRCGGSRQGAAHELGIHRTTLYRKMKKLGLIGVEETEGHEV